MRSTAKKIFRRLGMWQMYFGMLKLETEMSIGAGNIFVRSFGIRKSFSGTGGSINLGNGNYLKCELVLEGPCAKIAIGDKCFINGGTQIICRVGITFGNYVTVASGVTIYDHDSHSKSHLERRMDIDQQLVDEPSGNFISNKSWQNVNAKSVTVEDDVWIGMNCILLKGVTIGKGSIIGAGSVVTKSVPPFSVVAGNPARIVGVSS